MFPCTLPISLLHLEATKRGWHPKDIFFPQTHAKFPQQGWISLSGVDLLLHTSFPCSVQAQNGCVCKYLRLPDPSSMYTAVCIYPTGCIELPYR